MSHTDTNVDKLFQSYRDAPDEQQVDLRMGLIDQLQAGARSERLTVAAYNIVPLVGAVLSGAKKQVVVEQMPIRSLRTVTGTIGWADQRKLELICNDPQNIVRHYRPYGYRIPLAGITDIISTVDT